MVDKGRGVKRAVRAPFPHAAFEIVDSTEQRVGVELLVVLAGQFAGLTSSAARAIEMTFRRQIDVRWHLEKAGPPGKNWVAPPGVMAGGRTSAPGRDPAFRMQKSPHPDETLRFACEFGGTGLIGEMRRAFYLRFCRGVCRGP